MCMHIQKHLQYTYMYNCTYIYIYIYIYIYTHIHIPVAIPIPIPIHTYIYIYIYIYIYTHIHMYFLIDIYIYILFKFSFALKYRSYIQHPSKCMYVCIHARAYLFNMQKENRFTVCIKDFVFGQVLTFNLIIGVFGLRFIFSYFYFTSKFLSCFKFNLPRLKPLGV